MSQRARETRFADTIAAFSLHIGGEEPGEATSGLQ
jgi:hypothetical protein